MDADEKTFQRWGLVRFLRKIDLCVLIPYLAYTFAVNFMSLFVEYQYLKFEIPTAAVAAACVVIMAISVLIYRYFHKDTSDIKRLWIYLSWFVFLPLIYNIALCFIFDSTLYDYTGVFFGGLGQFIYRLIIIGICLVALVIFCIVRLIVRKRHEKGRFSDPEKTTLVKDHINLIVFIIGMLFAVVLAIDLGVIVYQEQKEEKRIQAVYDFRTEMLNKLPDGYDLTGIIDEAKLICMCVKFAYDGEIGIEEIEKENGNLLRCTTVKKEIAEKGLENYRRFTDEYQLDTCFHDGSSTYVMDPFKKIVYIGFDGSCTKSGERRICNFVCAYDENWNLTDVFCIANYLDSLL